MTDCKPMRSGAIGFLGLVTFLGCSSFDPQPMDEKSFLSRGQTKQEGNVRVTVAALGADEAEQLFGVPLASDGIQAVWVEIENQGKQFLWFVSAALDPEYYAPNEAAYKSHYIFSSSANDQMDRHFEKMRLEKLIPTGTTTSGFVFTNFDQGRKFLTIDLIGINEAKRFTFLVRVPGLHVDSDQGNLANLYALDEMVHYESETDFREALEGLFCCTTNADGTALGDPVNVVLIGKRSVLAPLVVSRGWHVTEVMYQGSIWKTVKSFLFGSRYRYSPISPLYYFGRPQDLGGQKARETIDERNHFRAWLAPMTFQGLPVWMVQISRDIGVRFTTQTWNLTTHKIDPDVDEARNYLFEDLLYSGGLTKIGWIKGVGPADRSLPRQNLTGDPYFTDGFRAVLLFDGEMTDLDEVGIFPWERPYAEKARGAQARPELDGNEEETQRVLSP